MYVVLESEEARTKRFDSIHAGIRAVSLHVPMSTTMLFDELKANFPHKRFSTSMLSEFILHSLRICDYIPRIRDKILDHIVQRCLEIDVEIVIEESGEVRIQREATSTEDDGAPMPSEESLLDTSLAQQSVQTNSTHHVHHAAEASRIPQEVQESADKLDTMLQLVVQYVHRKLTLDAQSKPTGNNSNTSLLDFLPMLLKIFEKRLLVTHRSKFVQFVFFFATSQDSLFAEHFTKRLLVIAQDLQAPSSVRVSATMYLASFVSRAEFLSLELVQDTVQRMLDWCLAYVLCFKADTLQLLTDAKQHQLKKKYSALRKHAKQSANTMQPHHAQYLATATGQSNALHGIANGNSSAFIQGVAFDEHGRLQVREHTAQQHEVFYAMVQGIAYVFCFHGVTLVDLFQSRHQEQLRHPSTVADSPISSGIVSQLQQTQTQQHPTAPQSDDYSLQQALDSLVSCRLDPLRYCLKTVRYEFLRLVIARQLLSTSTWLGIHSDLLLFENDLDNEDNEAEDEEDERGEDARSQHSDVTNDNGFDTQAFALAHDNSILRYYHTVLSHHQQEQLQLRQQLSGSVHNHGHDSDARSVASAMTRDSSAYSTYSSYSNYSNASGRSSSGHWSSASSVITALQPANLMLINGTQNTSVTGNGHAVQGSTTLGPNTLESFFPFDPCLLHELHKQIAAGYRVWDGVPGVAPVEVPGHVQDKEGRRGRFGEAQDEDIVDDDEELSYDSEENDEDEDDDDDEDDEDGIEGSVSTQAQQNPSYLHQHHALYSGENAQQQAMTMAMSLQSDDGASSFAMSLTSVSSPLLPLLHYPPALLKASSSAANGNKGGVISRSDPSHPLASGAFLFGGPSSASTSAPMKTLPLTSSSLLTLALHQQQHNQHPHSHLYEEDHLHPLHHHAEVVGEEELLGLLPQPQMSPRQHQQRPRQFSITSTGSW